MPSFDIVSEVDMHELANAVDQTNRELGTRYDFKGSDAGTELKDSSIVLSAESEFQLKQIVDILYLKTAKRGVDVGSFELGDVETSGRRAHQTISVRQGIDRELAKKLVKIIKDSRLKVQASVQGEQLRVSGKKRDDLQAVIAMLREQEVGLPLQYVNFRD